VGDTCLFAGDVFLFSSKRPHLQALHNFTILAAENTWLKSASGQSRSSVDAYQNAFFRKKPQFTNEFGLEFSQKVSEYLKEIFSAFLLFTSVFLEPLLNFIGLKPEKAIKLTKRD